MRLHNERDLFFGLWSLSDWYAAQCMGGLESTACYHLDLNDIEFFAPVVKFKNDKERKLFPGYIFVHLTREEECFVVNRTRGVIHMLPKWAERPHSLPDGFVEEVRDRLDSGFYEPPDEDELLKKFLPQQTVQALTGPMRDKAGRFLRYSKGSGIVLGYLLGKEFEYKVPLHQLRAVEKPSAPKSRSAPHKSKANA